MLRMPRAPGTSPGSRCSRSAPDSGESIVIQTDPLIDVAEFADEPRQASGNWNPSWESFARLDPEWTEKVIAMAIAPTVSGALDTKTIELIRVALDASCTNLDARGVRRHIRRALQSGATKQEITAVLQLASLQGLYSMRVGAPILLEELQARQSQDP
jgi:alkylhydroperoxidase/carboxymuconolactone decarboxylase family protein YurZ